MEVRKNERREQIEAHMVKEAQLYTTREFTEGLLLFDFLEEENAALLERLLRDRPRITPKNAHEWPPPYPFGRHCAGATCECKPPQNTYQRAMWTLRRRDSKTSKSKNPLSTGRFACNSPCTGGYWHLIERVERASWRKACSLMSSRYFCLYASEGSEPLRWFAQMTGELWLPLLHSDLRCPDRSGVWCDQYHWWAFGHPWSEASQELREEMDGSSASFRRWGHQEKPMLLPLGSTGPGSDCRKRYDAAVRMWQRMHESGERAQRRREWAHADGESSDSAAEDEPVAPDVEDEWERLISSWEDRDWSPC